MSITQIGTDFINKLLEYFSDAQGMLTISQLERDLPPIIQAVARDITSLFLQEMDAQLLADKSGRREAGYAVERHGDQRRVLTTIGELNFERTYYAHRDGRHAYLLDMAAGLENYARISDGVSVAVAAAACEMSYAKSSEHETGGAVSRQTVMNQVRGCGAVRPPEPPEKRRVAVLHIDADEDHVTMRGGKNSIVPLISVYEGIEKKGKRGSCINVFHISEYGKSTEDLWEQALSEVESRYDLNGTRVYLHGDGAAWIKQGLEWFPQAIYVLDKYHKNKAITAMTAGLDKLTSKFYREQIRFALENRDSRFLFEIADSLISQRPEREDKIREAAGYLNNHIGGVAICNEDPEANNGGCTEPHVSHVLSSRLSARPLAWSAKTLKQLAPMLANGGEVEPLKQQQQHHERILVRATRAASRKIKKIQFAPDPDSIGTLRPQNTGKVTQLYRTLHSISQNILS
jgi:hypothetical protein